MALVFASLVIVSAAPASPVFVPAPAIVKALRVQPITKADPLGREVLLIAQQHFDAIFKGLEVNRPMLFWGDSQGSYSGPMIGVVIDRKQIDALVRASGATYRRTLSFALAHEIVHFVQFQIYEATFMLDKNNTRLSECQADVLGAKAIVTEGLAIPGERERLIDESRHWAELAIELGDSRWSDPTAHPRPDQRMIAIAQGIDGAIALSPDPSAVVGVNPEVDAIADVDDFWWSMPVCARLTQWHDVTVPWRFRQQQCFSECNADGASCIDSTARKCREAFVTRELPECLRTQSRYPGVALRLCDAQVPQSVRVSCLQLAGEQCLEKGRDCSQRCIERNSKPESSDSQAISVLNNGIEQPVRVDVFGSCVSAQFKNHRACLMADLNCARQCNVQAFSECRSQKQGAWCVATRMRSFVMSPDVEFVGKTQIDACLSSCVASAASCHSSDGFRDDEWGWATMSDVQKTCRKAPKP